MTEFKMNSGEVEIVLNKEEFTLKPNYLAASAVSRQFDGYGNARAALVRENFDAAVFVIRVGLNLSGKDARDLPERVYKNGLTAELLIPLIEYVAILENGGRPVEISNEESKEPDPNE